MLNEILYKYAEDDNGKIIHIDNAEKTLIFIAPIERRISLSEKVKYDNDIIPMAITPITQVKVTSIKHLKNC